MEVVKSEGDAVGVAYDSDTRELRFYLNGVDQSVWLLILQVLVTRDYFPFSAGSSSTVFTYSVNFGQKPFKFPPPDGFQPLTSSTVRPDTVVPRPDQYMNTVIYTGTGAEKVLDVGFKPDFSYFSIRNDTGYVKYNFDSVE